MINLSKAFFIKMIEGISERSEASLFLKEFRSLPKYQFAVIYISEEVLSVHLQTLAYNIAIMNQLGIYPLLVVDSDPHVFQEAITRHFGSARYLDQVFRVKSSVSGSLKCSFQLEVLQDLVEQGVTPILHYSDQSINLPYDYWIAEELVKVVRPKKYIILTHHDGIYDRGDHLLSFLNLSSRRERGSVSVEFEPLVDRVYGLLRSVEECSVIVTSAENILREILTVKGSGTFIKAHHICQTRHFRYVSQRAISAVLENAFHKKLKKGYFDQSFDRIFYQKEYEGVAIVKMIDGIPYLDKFAVKPMFQGTGLGKSLWEKVIRAYPRLIWRAAPTNSLNKFYLKECSGCLKYPRWNIFWRELSLDEVVSVRDLILQKEPSFAKH